MKIKCSLLNSRDLSVDPYLSSDESIQRPACVFIIHTFLLHLNLQSYFVPSSFILKHLMPLQRVLSQQLYFLCYVNIITVYL
jgi:hypothetical protein